MNTTAQEATVVLGFSPSKGDRPYHVDEIRGKAPVVQYTVEEYGDPQDVEVGDWISEGKAKELGWAIHELIVRPYRLKEGDLPEPYGLTRRSVGG
ncbi:MAG: hypothetical protein V3T81_06890 [Thermoanaerobaculia bacterium]